MNYIDHAIESLEALRDCYARASDAENVARTLAELAGWLEVRDGLPANPNMYYGYKARYEQAKADARRMREERETQP